MPVFFLLAASSILAGRAEYQRILSILTGMRGVRPPLDRGRLIEHCLAVDAGDLKTASELVFALKWFRDGGRPKPQDGRPRLVVDNTEPKPMARFVGLSRP